MKYRITKASTTGKDYIINELEEHFFMAFYDELSVQQNSKINLQRMSDGTLSVYYNSFPVGKIKLQGRKFYMQILKGVYTSKNIYGTIDDLISHIPDWKRYIRLHCK